MEHTWIRMGSFLDAPMHWCIRCGGLRLDGEHLWPGTTDKFPGATTIPEKSYIVPWTFEYQACKIG